jgi:hypothetical protein
MLKFKLSKTLPIILALSVFLSASAVWASADTDNAEVLKVTNYTASEAGAIVKFDKVKVTNEMYAHVLENNKGIDKNKALKIAQQLAINFEAADINAKNSNVKSNEKKIVSLGQVVDGQLKPVVQDKTLSTLSNEAVVQPMTYIPDSYTSIISQGWTVNPYTKSHTLWVQYRISWDGLDLYKVNTAGQYMQSTSSSTSVSVGFQGTADFPSTVAGTFGLQVTANHTATQTISSGFVLNVSAWHKTMIRPYVYYYNDTYEGTYRYYVYNNLSQIYSYVYETRTAVNSYDIEKATRVWDRVNSTQSLTATSPVPPSSWEW